MTADLGNGLRWHPDPLRYPLKQRRNAAWIQRATNSSRSNQSPKDPSFLNPRLLEPNSQPPYGLSRQECPPALPRLVGLSPSDQSLAGAVRQEFNIPHVERHELAA